MQEKIKERRAAIIPWFVDKENGKVEMLFMRPSDPKYGGPLFQIAKGRIDPGENAKEAAVREGGEELGLFAGNIEKISYLGEFGYGRIATFLAKIKDKNLFGDPHYETGEVKWMTAEEFIATGRDFMKPMVRAASRRIIRLLGGEFRPT